MSIVMFNRRLTSMTSSRWMIAHWIFFGLLIAYTTSALFMIIFQCNPQKANFDLIAAGKLSSAPKCISEDQIGISLSTIHVVMDFCLLSVPIMVLWRVQMPLATKIRFFIVFVIGAMSCIGSVFRQIEQAKLKTDILCQNPLRLSRNVIVRIWKLMEFSDNYLGLFTWAAVDLTCGVIAANLPTLGVLIPHSRKDLYKSFSSMSKHTSKTTGKPSFHEGRGSTSVRDLVPHSASEESQEGIFYHVDIELHSQDSKGTKFPYTAGARDVSGNSGEWNEQGYQRQSKDEAKI
jgi:hypothetical protein